MENKIARMLSVLLHPLLVPTYFMIVLFQLSRFSYFFLSLQYKLLFIAFVFTVTFLIPSTVVFVLKILKVVESLSLEKRSERALPLLLVAILYFIIFVSMQHARFDGYKIFTTYILGSTVLMLVSLGINYFTKISLHAIAWGGFTGALIALSILFRIQLFGWLFDVIFLSGLVAFARLQLNAHNQTQIYSGYLLGFAFMLSLFLFL